MFGLEDKLHYKIKELKQKIKELEAQLSKQNVGSDQLQCKFCKVDVIQNDFGYGKEKVCKSCLTKAIDKQLDAEMPAPFRYKGMTFFSR